MLETIKTVILESWVVQYITLGLFFIGIFSKCWLSSYYTRSIRKVEDITHTKDKVLKKIALKYESSFRLNGYVRNTATMSRRYFYSEKRLGLNLNSIHHLSDLCKLITILLCTAAGAFIYASMGMNKKLILTIAFAVYTVIVSELFDRIVDIPNKEKVLFCHVEDYLENTLEEKLKVSQVTSRKEIIENEVRKQASEQFEEKAEDSIRINLDRQLKNSLSNNSHQIITDVLEEYL